MEPFFCGKYFARVYYPTLPGADRTQGIYQLYVKYKVSTVKDTDALIQRNVNGGAT